jgi:predicted nucleic acid-binding protein
VRTLLQAMTSLPVDDQVAERAGQLRRMHAIRLPDALIAATALEHRLTLATRNARDFSGVKGLHLRIPD